MSDFRWKLEYPKQELGEPKVLQNNFSILQNKQRRIQMKAMLGPIPPYSGEVLGLFSALIYITININTL